MPFPERQMWGESRPIDNIVMVEHPPSGEPHDVVDDMNACVYVCVVKITRKSHDSLYDAKK